MTEPTEEWRQCSKLYEVSSLGNVRSLDEDGLIRNVLKPFLDSSGYPCVCICEDGRQLTQRVHRLVATVFIPNLGDKPQVNHVDCNKLNNTIANLEWCTPFENMQHSYKEGIHLRKLSEADVVAIKRLIVDNMPLQEIADKYCMAYGTIYKINTCEIWKHVPWPAGGIPVLSYRLGSTNPSAKLNDDIVRGIRKSIEQGLSNAEIGRLLGVHSTTISKIRRGKAWCHVI